MLSDLKSPGESINKAYLKVKPNRKQIETFKTSILSLLDNINNSESEEYNKNLVSEYLKNTWYFPQIPIKPISEDSPSLIETKQEIIHWSFRFTA